MRMKHFYKTWGIFVFSIVCATLFSCSNELHMLFPEGPEGPAGKSAYEVWVDEVNNGNIDWPNDRTDVNNFFLYLKGEDGKDGQDGKDGKSAYEIWIEEVNKGLDNPHNPGTNWPKDEVDINDFWYYLTGADGKDGVTPNIGSNGNWWVNGEDTGVPAKGEDGEDGKDGNNGSMPNITIGENGNWYINGEDTGKPSRGEQGPAGGTGEGGEGTPGPTGPQGPQGPKGDDGKSAYELWKEAVEEGLENPHNPGNDWPKDKVNIDDFWDYLRGEDGKDGENGKDGVTIIQQPKPEEGKYNVIAQYSVDGKEYINWVNGYVKYLVYDKTLEGLANTEISITGLENKYTTDDNGFFYVPNSDLPEGDIDESNPFVTATVNGETTPQNTYVPRKMKIRLRIDGTPSFEVLENLWAFDVPGIEIPFVVERKVDASSDWETVPGDVGEVNRQIHVYNIANNEQRGSETKEYDLSKKGTLLIYRKIISSKDGTLNGENLAGLDYLVGGSTHRPVEYWGNYNEETDARYNTISFGHNVTSHDDSNADGCYGQEIKLTNGDDDPVAIEDVPLQPMPLLDEIKVTYEYLSTTQAYVFFPKMRICSSTTFLSSKIYEELLFDKEFENNANNVENYVTYSPQKVNTNDFYKKNIYVVHYSKGNHNAYTTPQYLSPEEGNEYFTFSGTENALDGSTIQLLPRDVGKYNFFAYNFANIVFDKSENKFELKPLVDNQESILRISDINVITESTDNKN